MGNVRTVPNNSFAERWASAARPSPGVALQMIDSTTIRAHRAAGGENGGFKIRHSAVRGVGSRRREQLASDKIEARLGGIYTLERISRENPDATELGTQEAFAADGDAVCVRASRRVDAVAPEERERSVADSGPIFVRFQFLLSER
jgi:hypothetical protein